jgi:predicted DNA-binding protein YlxM (UPF0122 family)
MKLDNKSFAERVSEQLQSFFLITNGEELASVIAFNAKFLAPEQLDDLSSLLFIEFSKVGKQEITLAIAKRIVAKIQKRLYRGSRKREKTLDIDIADQTQVSQSQLHQKIEEFVATLEIDDILLFRLHFLEGKEMIEICKEIGLQKTTVYRRLSELRKRFERFASDAN